MKNSKDSFVVDRFKSVKYALKGLWMLLKSENSIKLQFGIGIALTFLGFSMNISTSEWTAQFLAIGLVMVAEGLNTSIEKIANFIHPEYHEKIGEIKDIAAGAVAIAALVSFVIGFLIYLPKFIN
ncbi:MAG: diacylglycerol kinase family protein [Flavicella sp.]|jgi:diacylglycerol kinase (ATP)|nr:diacylglycerol kinase family protein [Flavicella sp.]